jgi:hypothetical protein
MYDELKSNIYDGIAKYLDSLDIGQDESGIDTIVIGICDAVDEAFDNTFFAPAPITLDTTTQN